MFTHKHQIRVRYGETDQMKYLYYGNYALYFEVARAEAMRSIGISYKYQEETLGIMMPVMSLQCRYIRPAHYDDLLTIHTEIRKLPSNFIVFHHEVYNERKKLLTGGTVKLAFVDAESGKRSDVPPYLLEQLQSYFN